MMAMKQIERIKQMEEGLEQVKQSVTELSAAIDKCETVAPLLQSLKDYYGSDFWKQDFADDEAGHLPSDLKRGVLSEDGIWNVLDDCRHLAERMQKLAESIS